MSILIKGMEMPTSCRACMFSRTDIRNVDWCVLTEKDLPCDCPIFPVPPHGRLIDADALRQTMYHGAFETDSPMQKWDSGCWIRYKMFENALESAPTIIEAEKEKNGQANTL